MISTTKLFINLIFLFSILFSYETSLFSLVEIVKDYQRMICLVQKIVCGDGVFYQMILMIECQFIDNEEECFLIGCFWEDDNCYRPESNEIPSCLDDYQVSMNLT